MRARKRPISSGCSSGRRCTLSLQPSVVEAESDPDSENDVPAESPYASGEGRVIEVGWLVGVEQSVGFERFERLFERQVSINTEPLSRVAVPLNGYALIVFAALIRIYQRRRSFYGGLDVDADWEPTYGSVVYARTLDKVLSLGFGLAVLFGIAVLFREYLPTLFREVFGFLIRLTA